MALKERVEDNVALWLLGMLFTGFVAGIGAYKAILEIARLEVVPETSNVVTLDREVNKLKDENQRLRDDNEQFRSSNAAMTRRVEALVTQVREARSRASAPEPDTGRKTAAAGAPNVVSLSTSPEPRFIDHEDGTISDKKTGLMWTREDSAARLGKCLSWDDSDAWVKTLSTGGHSDWRMPSTDELKAIAGATLFVSGASRHWSYNVGTPGNFLYVAWDGGFVGGWKGTLCSGAGVRAVRQEGAE